MNLPFPLTEEISQAKISSLSKLKFEKALKNFFEIDNVFLFSNCFIAISIVLKFLDEGRNKKVVTTAYSYRRTKDIIRWAELEPLYLDSCQSSFSMSPEILDGILRKHSNDVGVVLAQHSMVKILDYEGIEGVCEKYNVPLIFDSVEVTSPGKTYPHVGSHGEFEVFSLHPSKVVNGCEGGVVTCPSDSLALEFKNFLSRIGHEQGIFNIPSSHSEFGNACLKSYGYWRDICKLQNEKYSQFFSQFKEISFIEYDTCKWSPNYKTSLIEFHDVNLRDNLILALQRNNIPLRRMYFPFVVPEKDRYPCGVELSEALVFLPVGESVKRLGQEKVIECLSQALEDHYAQRI